MSNIFEKNKNYIIIGVTVIVFIGIIYYITQKNNKLMSHIEDLKQRVEELEDTIQKLETSPQKPNSKEVLHPIPLNASHIITNNIPPNMYQSITHNMPQNVIHMNQMDNQPLPNHNTSSQMHNQVNLQHIKEKDLEDPNKRRKNINSTAKKGIIIDNKDKGYKKSKSPEIITEKKHIIFNTQIEEAETDDDNIEDEDLDAELENELKDLEELEDDS